MLHIMRQKLIPRLTNWTKRALQTNYIRRGLFLNFTLIAFKMDRILFCYYLERARNTQI